MDCGDAFVIARDGRLAGLAREVGDLRLEQITAADERRWGVWAVWFPYPMRTRDDARRNFAAIVPLLRPHWEATARAWQPMKRYSTAGAAAFPAAMVMPVTRMKSANVP